VSAYNNQPLPPNQGGPSKVRSRPGDDGQPDLFDAPTPDPVELFARLDEAQRRLDAPAACKLQAALRAVGWSVIGITPPNSGSGR
jgi:hypothetical protein